MSPFQIIMLVIAAGLILSTFWDDLQSLVKNMKPKPKPNPSPDQSWIDDIADHVVREKTNLMMIVACWENLRDKCEDAGLDQAVEELTHIWPLLVDAEGGNDVKIN